MKDATFGSDEECERRVLDYFIRSASAVKAQQVIV